MSKESRINNLILQLMFSGFNYPEESRFFKILPSQHLTKTLSNGKNRKSLNIEPENVANGKDKRTSIIIKNLPKDISKEELKLIIEPLGNINFIYIPLLNKNKNNNINNLPCAYINVINYKSILKIIQSFKEKKILNSINLKKDFTHVEIFYSGTQGKDALIKRFLFEKKYLPPKQQISFL